MSKGFSLLFIVIVIVLSCSPKGKIGSGVYIGTMEESEESALLVDSVVSASQIDSLEYATEEFNPIPEFDFLTDSSYLRITFLSDSISFTDSVKVYNLLNNDSVSKQKSEADINVLSDTLLVPIKKDTAITSPKLSIADLNSDTISTIKVQDSTTVFVNEKVVQDSVVQKIKADTISSQKKSEFIKKQVQDTLAINKSKTDSIIVKNLELKQVSGKTLLTVDTALVKIGNAPANESDIKLTKTAIDTSTQIKKDVVIISRSVSSNEADTIKTAAEPVDINKTNAESILAPIGTQIKKDSLGTINQSDKTIIKNSEIQTPSLTVKADSQEAPKLSEANNGTKKLEIVPKTFSQAKKEVDQKVTGTEDVSKTSEAILFYFETGQKYSNNQSSLVDSAYVAFSKSPHKKILISGYTDAVGKASSNMALSFKRVESIKQALIKKGIDERFIFIQYFGEKYATDNKHDQNRRVEVIIN